MTEHLRYLAQHARTYLSCLPNAGPAVDRRRPHALRPHPRAARRRAGALRRGVRHEHRRRLLRHHARAPPGRRRARRRPRARRARHRVHEPGCSSVYSQVPFHQDTSFLVIGERTNANGSKKFREAMLDGDLDTCVQMAREQVKEGAHVIDVCVDYVGRDGTADMHELVVALRHPGPAPDGARLHRAAGHGSRAPALGRQGDPQLGQPRGRRGPGLTVRPGDDPRPRLRRGGDLPRDRRGGPGPHRRLEVRGLQAHPRPRGRALRHGARRTSSSTASPSRSARARRTSAATASRPSRRSAG